MHYVYLIQSAVDNRRRYTGFTHNLRARIASHNT
ncbi:MAG: GIY-YIG nuclease family protein, partial [Opitutaceae bacterium]